jgi:hypothetical protein
MLWCIYIYEETLINKIKKKKLPLCSKDLDNPTYGLFKKPGRYTKSVGNHSSWILYGGRLEEGICYHEEESPPINWPQQYQEEECQSQLVVNPNGHYMEDEGAYYHEQVVTLRSKEVIENQVDERKEEQTEVPQEPHKEKEESTKTSSTLALILETLRGQKRSLLELPSEQTEDIKKEKLPEDSPYIITVLGLKVCSLRGPRFNTSWVQTISWGHTP